MERKSVRAWRRIQEKRIWHKRLRNLYFYGGYNTNGFRRTKEYESWKELVKVKWCHQYKDTGRPCSCALCKRERYNRIKEVLETNRIIKEELDD